jgi:hypothetical protein
MAVAELPDCGCDACDSGSADLLDAIDETIGYLVGGPFVMLRGPGWYVRWHPEGRSSGSTSLGGTGPVPDHGPLIELCRRLARGEDVRLPDRTDAFVGRPWLD